MLIRLSPIRFLARSFGAVRRGLHRRMCEIVFAASYQRSQVELQSPRSLTIRRVNYGLLRQPPNNKGVRLCTVPQPKMGVLPLPLRQISAFDLRCYLFPFSVSLGLNRISMEKPIQAVTTSRASVDSSHATLRSAVRCRIARPPARPQFSQLEGLSSTRICTGPALCPMNPCPLLPSNSFTGGIVPRTCR